MAVLTPYDAKADESLIGRLCRAKDHSRKTLEAFRAERVDAVKSYAGNHWGEGGSSKKRYLNLLSHYCQITARTLINKEPRVNLATFHRAAKATVETAKTWVNDEFERMQFSEIEQRIVYDALFLLGIAKVALSTPADSAASSWGIESGRPFVKRVDFDDFAFDLRCTDLRDASWVMHRYEMPVDLARKLSYFDRSARKDLKAADPGEYNQEGDQRISSLGREPFAGMREDFEDQAEVWEAWLPRHRKIITFTGDSGYDKVLRVQNWIGPHCGPYHYLTLGGVVPGNPLGKAPIMDLIDLDEAINVVWRKLVQQAFDQKDNLLYSGPKESDTKRYTEAPNGTAVRYEGSTPPMIASWAGPNPANFQLVQALKELFNGIGGNLDLLSGAAPQSKTATQDKILASGAMGTVGDKQDYTHRHVSSVANALIWYYWHHPELEMEAAWHPPGMPEYAEITRATPADRARIPWEKVRLRVDPYSYRHKTPEERLGQTVDFVKNIILPMMPIAVQQGVTMDLGRLVKMAAEYLDSPEIEEIIISQEPPAPEEGGLGGGTGATMPVSTERSYTRRSESNGNAEANADIENTMSAMMQKPGSNSGYQNA